jgi:rubredoxin-NAD+ reductase
MPLMQQARALAATLAGKPTAVVYPAMPVTVKTPACPTVVCPPPMGATVEWTSEVLEGGCAALAHGSDGSLQGFALMGSATCRKQELVKALPPLME